MDFATLDILSYRELQAQAKSLGIAANKKKEILIELILESQIVTTDSPSEHPSDAICKQPTVESVTVEKVESSKSAVMSAVEETGEAFETTDVITLEIESDADIDAVEVTEDAEDEVVTDVIAESTSPVLAEISVLEASFICDENDVVVDVIEEITTPVAAEMSMLEASFIGEVMLEDEECDVDFDVDAHFEEEYDEVDEEVLGEEEGEEGYWEEDEECLAEEGAEELTEMLSDMKLRGLPTPQGTKTVFNCEQQEGNEKIDWGIDFNDNDNDNEEEDSENYSPQKRNTPFKVGGAGVTPKGKHTVFSSPELQVGSAVHWDYTAYDGSKSTPRKMVDMDQMASVVDGTPEQQTTAIAAAAPLASDLLMHAMTPGKALRTKEDQMDFWLSKGTKTPMR